MGALRLCLNLRIRTFLFLKKGSCLACGEVSFGFFGIVKGLSFSKERPLT